MELRVQTVIDGPEARYKDGVQMFNAPVFLAATPIPPPNSHISFPYLHLTLNQKIEALVCGLSPVDRHNLLSCRLFMLFHISPHHHFFSSLQK